MPATSPLSLSLAFPVLLALTVSVAPTEAKMRESDDFADPFVLREGATYYAFSTGAHGKHFQVARSADLATWTMLPDALPLLPAWASRAPGLTWAPAVLRRGASYVLYYSAADTLSGFQCISRATSAMPQGPYVDDSTGPFVCDRRLCGAIDPSPFVDEGGRAYLLWKSDENSTQCRGESRIWSQLLADDGLAVTGTPTQLLAMDQAWERPLIEAPAMVLHRDRYFLFYSANWYESADYAIGYATCARPVGPCRKMTLNAPLVRSWGARLGPGGQDFFQDEKGSTWMTYHAWSAPRATYAAGGARSLRFARIGFADGIPRLDGGF
jgi:beta-xylosidase